MCDVGLAFASASAFALTYFRAWKSVSWQRRGVADGAAAVWFTTFANTNALWVKTLRNRRFLFSVLNLIVINTEAVG